MTTPIFPSRHPPADAESDMSHRRRPGWELGRLSQSLTSTHRDSTTDEDETEKDDGNGEQDTRNEEVTRH